MGGPLALDALAGHPAGIGDCGHCGRAGWCIPAPPTVRHDRRRQTALARTSGRECGTGRVLIAGTVHVTGQLRLRLRSRRTDTPHASGGHLCSVVGAAGPGARLIASRRRTMSMWTVATLVLLVGGVAPAAFVASRDGPTDRLA